MPSTGALVQGSYGHSSVWDPLTKRIYVYGGYQSESSSTYGLTDSLYSFDPSQRVWRTHPSSGSFRYLHSAIMSGGLMLVYGGNTHNETSTSNVRFRLLLCAVFPRNIFINCHLHHASISLGCQVLLIRLYRLRYGL